MTLQEFLPMLKDVSGSGSQYSAKCPAHDDKKASLSVSSGDDGRILLDCHAGCNVHQITAALNLKVADLFPPKQTYNSQSPKPKVIAEYVYTDLNGVPTAKKLRYSNKGFCWLKPDNQGGWTKGRSITPLPYNCYHAKNQENIYLVEGEKDVETIKKLGKIAVTLPDGADSKWIDAYNDFFKNKNVAVIQDNDDKGKSFALDVANRLAGQAKSVKIIDLSKIWDDMPKKADISDYIAAGKSFEKVSELVSKTEQCKYKPKNPLAVISAPDLQKANLPPTKFLVNDILPEGTAMISAPSKIGKSWFVLDMGLSIAAGTPFMEHDTNTTGVLYLALEDSLTRLQNRMNKVLDGLDAPEQFDFSIKAPTLSDGLIETLEDHLKAHPQTTLIIIDTLQKIRGLTQGRESAYAQDYREMGILKDFADKHKISIFLVHHTRKMKDEGDAFNMISGTNGIMGAADTVFVMTKDKRDDKNAVLHITGRDVDQVNDMVTFNKDVWKWQRVGDAGEIQRQQEIEDFNENPIVRTIQYVLDKSTNDRWSGRASDLLEEGKFFIGKDIAESPKKLGYDLRKLDKKLLELGNIKMDTSTNGNAGKIYSFHLYQADNDFIDLVEDNKPPC